MGEQHTRPLAELRRADEPHFGAKSTSLGELITAGIEVPAGFAIAADAYLDVFGERGLEGKGAEDSSAEIRATPLPAELRAEIAQAYERLADAAGDREPAVAVRSSAIGEDSEEATFAGQQETYLWLRGLDRVAESVRDCWASLYNPEAVAYRAEIAAGRAVPAMGVTIQLMVDAAVSGVMFTCNPINGDPSTVAVNASWGLGLAVVGGEVTPDEYRVSKVTREVLSRSIGPKLIEYVPDPSGSGSICAEVAAERRNVPCLDDRQLTDLVDVARQVEAHFSAPQDIEWAIAREPDSDDRQRLLLLQSRPVTVKPPKPAAPAGPRSAMDRVWSTFGAGGAER